MSRIDVLADIAESLASDASGGKVSDTTNDQGSTTMTTTTEEKHLGPLHDQRTHAGGFSLNLPNIKLPKGWSKNKHGISYGPVDVHDGRFRANVWPEDNNQTEWRWVTSTVDRNNRTHNQRGLVGSPLEAIAQVEFQERIHNTPLSQPFTAARMTTPVKLGRRDQTRAHLESLGFSRNRELSIQNSGDVFVAGTGNRKVHVRITGREVEVSGPRGGHIGTLDYDASQDDLHDLLGQAGFAERRADPSFDVTPIEQAQQARYRLGSGQATVDIEGETVTRQVDTGPSREGYKANRKNRRQFNSTRGRRGRDWVARDTEWLGNPDKKTNKRTNIAQRELRELHMSVHGDRDNPGGGITDVESLEAIGVVTRQYDMTYDGMASYMPEVIVTKRELPEPAMRYERGGIYDDEKAGWPHMAVVFNDGVVNDPDKREAHSAHMQDLYEQWQTPVSPDELAGQHDMDPAVGGVLLAMHQAYARTAAEMLTGGIEPWNLESPDDLDTSSLRRDLQGLQRGLMEAIKDSVVRHGLGTRQADGSIKLDKRRVASDLGERAATDMQSFLEAAWVSYHASNAPSSDLKDIVFRMQDAVTNFLHYVED
jgi:hypothetical protein